MPRQHTLVGGIRRSKSGDGTAGVPDDASRLALLIRLDQEAFLGVLSHELRTPVTTIYGGAQLLATRDLAEARRRALASDVGQEAERLYRIVEDLVVLLRSERDDLHPAAEPVAVGRLVVAAVERELGRNPGLEIRYLGASDAVAEQADEMLVVHAVRNLLDNAIRNGGEGQPIEVVVDAEADDVIVRVLDRGPIPVREAEAAHDVIATPAGLSGGGLGLFVAARLVQAMKGRSWARSRPDGGTEFGFALRRSTEPAAPTSA